jgi:hypothetical protein
MFSDYRLGLSKKYVDYPAKDNYPDYSKHQCIVARHLTLEMYDRLYKKVTPNGVTIDKCIQPSVDNTGKIIGLVAGDEESYEVFKELFDAVITIAIKDSKQQINIRFQNLTSRRWLADYLMRITFVHVVCELDEASVASVFHQPSAEPRGDMLKRL